MAHGDEFAPKGSECARKNGHQTKESAKQQLSSQLAKGAVNLKVYRCRYCKLFHVGHPPGTRTRARRRG
jgi:hypothetical protein